MHQIIAGSGADPGDWLPRFLRDHALVEESPAPH
jgi:hypothetical protein